MAKLVAVGQRIEGPARIRVTVQSARHVGRHRHRTRLGVEDDVHIQLITGGYPSKPAVLRADWEHELAAHRGHRAVICMTTNRHERLVTGAAERRRDVRRNAPAGGGLATKLDRGPKPHAGMASATRHGSD